MADKYQQDDAYDLWSTRLEKYFESHGELESQLLFFTRVSEKPQRLLEATNMTMEGKCRLARLLDLLLDGPDADWRVQNIIRSSGLVRRMLHSGLAGTIRLNDADSMGDITYHQWLAIVRACNEPNVQEAYRGGVESGASTLSLLSLASGPAGDLRAYYDGGGGGGSGSSSMSRSDLQSLGRSSGLENGLSQSRLLPGADTSVEDAAVKDKHRRSTIRHISEGVPGAQHHLRHIDHADEQYFRVKALIESMNVLMPGESKRMRAARHRRGAVNALVADVHEKRAEREKEREADEAIIRGA